MNPSDIGGSGGSGRRPIPQGARTPSTELVLVPKRILVELFSLILDMDEAILKLTAGRIEISATRRRFEELVQQYVPGLVLETILSRRGANEPTPVDTPEAKNRNIEQTKKP